MHWPAPWSRYTQQLREENDKRNRSISLEFAVDCSGVLGHSRVPASFPQKQGLHAHGFAQQRDEDKGGPGRETWRLWQKKEGSEGQNGRAQLCCLVQEAPGKTRSDTDRQWVQEEPRCSHGETRGSTEGWIRAFEKGGSFNSQCRNYSLTQEKDKNLKRKSDWERVPKLAGTSDVIFVTSLLRKSHTIHTA